MNHRFDRLCLRFATYRHAVMTGALFVAVLLGACTLTPPSDSATREMTADEPVDLVVFAAASLTDAMNEMADAFESAQPQVTVVRNFAGSSQLATQLTEGARADLFASANETQMQAAVDAGRIAGAPQIFATNRLVVLVPSDNPAGIETLADLGNADVQLVLAAPGVPIRAYSDQMIAALAADPAYGAAFADAVYANLVSEEANVRQVAAKVVLGEADVGVVYTSDVTPDIADEVQQIEVPDAHNLVATYPIAVVADAPQPKLAEEFVAFVLSEAGQAILVHWGFGPAPSK